jgi:cytidylate kinase
VKLKVLTVAREYGSGGARIAGTVAGSLGWKLLDWEIIDRIARAAYVEHDLVRHYDERVDSWLSRVNEEAYSVGNCVIVGRGAQCILQCRPDVFHVFVYAPLQERIERLRKRLPQSINDIERRIRLVDEARAHYLQLRFGKNWCNPHLYNLMISSQADEDATAKVILRAMTGEFTAIV